MTAEYEAFLATKSVVAAPVGIPDPQGLSDHLQPFQRDIVQWALRRGRAAIFAGTGLGKTLMQLVWADHVQKWTGRRVLIVTPLAVAQQTVAEAAKWGIDDVAYAADQSQVKTRIVVVNYDRIDKIDMADFVAIVLDESGIIKSQESATRRDLMERCAGVDYRLCCTATPAPNDYVELGNHAEFLGVMSQKEMLSMWFVHDGGMRVTSAANKGKPVADWRLKRHATRDFWRWIATWAVVIRRPSDLGYEDGAYILPPLIRKQITVAVDYDKAPSSGMLFPMEANTLQERIGARRDSVGVRVKASADIVNAHPDRPWLVWCGLNTESEALVKAIPGAVEVRGSDDRDVKSERLIGFATGKYRVMVTKASIAGFGMNYQHCADMVFVGVNDSFEQLYQSIRRCWRFGQTKPVTAYLIASELEGAVVANLDAKESAAEAMSEAMAEHMKDLCQREVRGGRVSTDRAHALQPMRIPEWLTAA